MDRQYGMADFFTMEATEYLERLDTLVSAEGPPSGEELQRLTRALRGAALMANQQAIAGAAGAFEQLARAIREGRHAWDEGTRQLAIRTVDDLKIFVRKARDWTEADTMRAREMATTLERAGGRPAPKRVSGSSTADAGTRAFVAREGAALGSAIARAAEAMKGNPALTEPVQTILQQMQPLRGLATLGEYPPLPDLLEGIERAAALVARAGPSVPEAAQLLDNGARALTQATREITASGKADADSAELRRFTSGLRTALGFAQPDVRIEELYEAEGASPVVAEETVPAGQTLGEVEVVSLGEHLKQIGVSIGKARLDVQRELRILGLGDPLRRLERGADATLRSAVQALARGTRDAITQGLVTREADAISMLLQDAGAALAARDVDRLTEAAETLVQLVPGPAAKPVAEPKAAPAPPTPTPTPIQVEEPAPTPATPPATAAPRPAPVADAADDRETADLAGSMLRYYRLLSTMGLGTPSLDELVAGPPATAPRHAAPAAETVGPAEVVAPTGVIEAPAAARPRPPEVPEIPEPEVPEPPEAAEAPEEPIPIEDLCYSGGAALERALSLQDQVRELVATGAPAGDVQELVEEVFDLIRLGRPVS